MSEEGLIESTRAIDGDLAAREVIEEFVKGAVVAGVLVSEAAGGAVFEDQGGPDLVRAITDTLEHGEDHPDEIDSGQLALFSGGVIPAGEFHLVVDKGGSEMIEGIEAQGPEGASLIESGDDDFLIVVLIIEKDAFEKMETGAGGVVAGQVFARFLWSLLHEHAGKLARLVIHEVPIGPAARNFSALFGAVGIERRGFGKAGNGGAALVPMVELIEQGAMGFESGVSALMSLVKRFPMFDEEDRERGVAGLGKGGAIDEVFPDWRAFPELAVSPGIEAIFNGAFGAVHRGGDHGKHGSRPALTDERIEDSDPARHPGPRLFGFLVELRELLMRDQAEGGG